MEIEVEGVENAGLIFYCRARKELSLCACSALCQGDIASMQAAVGVQQVAQQQYKQLHSSGLPTAMVHSYLGKHRSVGTIFL